VARKRDPNDVVEFLDELVASLDLWTVISADVGSAGDVARHVGCA
jgi:hypothetical protein